MPEHAFSLGYGHGRSLDTRPTLQARLEALEPLEPSPLAEVAPQR